MRPTARRIFATLLAGVVLLTALYAVLGFLVLPAVIERELPRQARERFDADARVGDVSFNPFLLTLVARALQVNGADGKPMLTARKLEADLSWSSLWRRGWRFDALRVDAPAVDLVLERDGRLNLARLAGRSADAAPGSGATPEFHVGELRIRHGSVAFTDRTRAAPETHALRWIDIELDRLSTRRDARGDLLATAVLPRGGAFATRARISLEPIAARGALRVSNLSAALPWSLLREANGTLARGRIDLQLDYDFDYRQRAPALRLSAIGLRAQGLALHEHGNGPTPPLALERVELRDGQFDLQGRTLVLPELRLGGGALRTVVEADGTLNWQRLFAGKPRDPAGAGSQPFSMRVQNLVVEGVDLDYVDRSRAQALRVAAGAVDANAAFDLSIGPDMRFSGAVSALSGSGFVIRADGGSDPPALASARVSLREASFDFGQRLVQLPQVNLERGTLRFDTARDGTMNWTRLFAAAPGGARTQPGTADGARPAGDPQAWRILLPGLRATRLDVAMTDLTRVRPLAVHASEVGGSLDLAVTPGAASGTVALDAIRLKSGRLAVHEVGAREAPALALASAQTAGGHFRGQDILISGLKLGAGSLRILVDAKGVMNWAALTSARTQPAASRKKPHPERAEPWRVRLPGVRAQGLSVRYRDASRALPLEIAAGRVDAALDLVANTGAADALHITGLNTSASAFTLGPAGAPPALRLARVEATDGSLRQDTLRFSRVRLADGSVQVSIDSKGQANLQRVFVTSDRAAGPAQSASGETAAAKGSAGMRVRLPRIEFARLRAAGTDNSRAVPLTVQAGSLNGSLGAEAGTDGVRLHGLTLAAEALTLARAGEKDALVRLGNLDVGGGMLDTGARSAAAKSVTLRGARLALARGEDGQIGMLRTLGLAQRDGVTPAPARVAPGSAERAAAWRYRVDTVQLRDIGLDLADRSFGAPIEYALDLEGSLRGLDSAAATGAALALRAQVEPGGSATISGTLPGAAQPMKLRLVASGLPLAPLQPALAHYAALDLKSGAFGADAEFSTARTADRGRKGSAEGAAGALRVSGSVEIDALRLDEAKTGDRFLAWKRLHAQSINFDAARKRLVIGQAVLDGAQARLEISREGELNLKQVLRDSGRADGGEAPSRPGEAAGRADDAFVAMVDRLRIRDGSLRFADRSLILPFVTDITQFNGTMVSLSNRPDDRAQLQVDGRVQPFGAARARGSIQLADPRAFTDVRAEFNNVPLPKLSPYTITFAGRAVAEGRLWLDLQYRIVDGELAGENEITMQDLRLGERVAAPRAIDLPLELAAALLTDDQGVLNLRVPVRGDLDNPTFDYKTVVRTAISNTLRRAVTAPLRFIGRLFGPDVEELDAIEFEPGSASLRPPEQEKLDVVAQSLAQRPKLALEVQGSYAAEEDARALRAIGLESALAKRMKLELGAGERMGPIAFGQTATQIALEQLFAAEFGEETAEALRARVAREAKDQREVRRVDREASDPIAAAGDPDVYRAMFEQLAQRQPLDPGALTTLASARTQSVLEYIVRQARTAEQRLTVAAVQPVRAEEELVPTRLRLRVLGTGKGVPLDLETVDTPQPEEREAATAEAPPS